MSYALFVMANLIVIVVLLLNKPPDRDGLWGLWLFALAVNVLAVVVNCNYLITS